ncbi:MAG: 4-hydroxyphenylpyruvate dioxygenase [bacterium]|nr:MAG: 4-hydroxyphenylpyruvate dioxygenase [bacterium]
MTETYRIFGVDYIELIVGNAKQASHYYQNQFGFEPYAYRGLETGDREKVSYALRQGEIRFIFTSPLMANSPLNIHLIQHGDGVKDVAFTVDDAKKAWKYAINRGAESVFDPKSASDEFGKVITASIRTYGDTIHTFVERQNYKGIFLPQFKEYQSPLETQSVGLTHIDHFVGNQPENQMQRIAEWYEDVLGFHRFWSADDKDVATEYSALRSIVVADPTEVIKMPINRPAVGLKKSQIQEFVEYYSGPGIQHIAMYTNDIVKTITQLQAKGVEFLDTPPAYYEELSKRVGKIDENMNDLKKLGILVDIDEFGYMLQIFTKPVQDRPTLFYEVIERKGSKSFGKGNFKALFEAIEREQAKRGNL